VKCAHPGPHENSCARIVRATVTERVREDGLATVIVVEAEAMQRHRFDINAPIAVMTRMANGNADLVAARMNCLLVRVVDRHRHDSRVG
jgi:hypothetical protein